MHAHDYMRLGGRLYTILSQLRGVQSQALAVNADAQALGLANVFTASDRTALLALYNTTKTALKALVDAQGGQALTNASGLVPWENEDLG